MRDPTIICAACRFFAHYSDSSQSGECRRRAPRQGRWGNWPDVRLEDWCGEFARNEEAPSS